MFNVFKKKEVLSPFEEIEKIGGKIYDKKFHYTNKIEEVYKIELNYLDLEKIPKIINEFTNLEELELNGNKIKKIENINNLNNLKKLEISNNNLEKIEGIDNLKNLEKFDLTDNDIEYIEGIEIFKNKNTTFRTKKLFLWSNSLKYSLYELDNKYEENLNLKSFEDFEIYVNYEENYYYDINQLYKNHQIILNKFKKEKHIEGKKNFLDLKNSDSHNLKNDNLIDINFAF